MRLVATYGPLCAACTTQFSECVDHDQSTQLARGFLCGDCNGLVDRCPHVSGCPYMDYLAYPPARVLGIRYPKRGRPAQITLAADERRARREQQLPSTKTCLHTPAPSDEADSAHSGFRYSSASFAKCSGSGRASGT